MHAWRDIQQERLWQWKGASRANKCMSDGYLYFSGGRSSFLREAASSAATVRQHDPLAEICLIHDHSPAALSEGDISVFNHVEAVNLPHGLPGPFDGQARCFLAKIQAMIQSPFERTLFLDSDTRVLAEVRTLFVLLNRFDMAAAHGPITQKPQGPEDPLSEVPDCFPELNTGVVLFRNNDRVGRFLAEWKALFQNPASGLFRKHGQGGEQVSFRYLLWKRPEISLFILSCEGMPNLYNYRWKARQSFSFNSRIKIHHCRQTDEDHDKRRKAPPGDAASAIRPPASKGAEAVNAALSPYELCMQDFDRHCEERGDRFFFVQVGAYDGSSYDPIMARIKTYNWQGILIEPVPHLFKHLTEHHRGNTRLRLENVAISDHVGSVEFNYFPETSVLLPDFPAWANGMGSLLPAFKSPGHQWLAQRGFKMVSEEVPCTTLEALLQAHQAAVVDLLQINAEGYDGMILAGLDFKSFRPKFIQFKDRHIQRVHEQGLTEVSLRQVVDHLSKAGYEVFSADDGFNRFCALKSPL